MSSPTPTNSGHGLEDNDPEAELDLFMAALPSNDASNHPDTVSVAADGVTLTHNLQSSRTNAILHARCTATWIGLGPYGQHELEKFSTESDVEQRLLMYAGILHLSQKVLTIALASGKYVVSTALLDNIQRCSFAVLLSPKLSYYKKGSVPVKRVLAVLTHLNSNLPPDFGTNYHVFKEIKKVVNTQLTQQRSIIKKALKSSKTKNQSIYELAVDLVDDTKCVVTVALCARLALLRKVHCEPRHDNPKFWDHVDTRLDLIRSKTEGDDDKLQAAVSGYLQKDRKKFGQASEQVASNSISNEWQNAVDDALMTAPPVLVPGGADDDDDEADGDDDEAAGSHP